MTLAISLLEELGLTEKVGDPLLGDHIEWVQPGGPHGLDIKGTGYVIRTDFGKRNDDNNYLVYKDKRTLSDVVYIPHAWVTKILSSGPVPKHIDRMIQKEAKRK